MASQQKDCARRQLVYMPVLLTLSAQYMGAKHMAAYRGQRDSTGALAESGRLKGFPPTRGQRPLPFLSARHNRLRARGS